MLSRVAESLFWMSRYIERAENTARALDVNFHLLLDLNLPAAEQHAYWRPLILASADEANFLRYYSEFTAERVTDYLVLNRENPNSVYSCLLQARENARAIIDNISSEMWEQINRIYHLVQSASPASIAQDPYLFYRAVKDGSHLFQGITDTTFLHGEGWEFMQVGKYLERADNTARLVDVKYHLLQPDRFTEEDAVEIIQWMAVLKSCSALEAFRRIHRSHVDPATVLHFLVLDQVFPRSCFFAVRGAEEALWRISGSSRHRPTNMVDRLIGKLEAELAYTTVADIQHQGLHDFLKHFEQRLIQIGTQIQQTYFASTLPHHETAAIRAATPPIGTWTQVQQQQ